MDFTFYYTIDAGSVREYMPSVPVLVPASSWANRNKYRGLPAKPRLPKHISEIAVDPGGFVFTMLQNGFGLPDGYVIMSIKRVADLRLD